MRRYFSHNREILQNQSVFNILTGQKRDMTELKLVWPVNTTGVPADLDPPRIGPPGPNPLADMDPPGPYPLADLDPGVHIH